MTRQKGLAEEANAASTVCLGGGPDEPRGTTLPLRTGQGNLPPSPQKSILSRDSASLLTGEIQGGGNGIVISTTRLMT